MAATKTQIYQIRHAASLGQAKVMAKAWGVGDQQLADILRGSGLETILTNIAKQHEEAGTAIPKQSQDIIKLTETFPSKTMYTAWGGVATTPTLEIKDKIRTAQSFSQAQTLAKSYGIKDTELSKILKGSWLEDIAGRELPPVVLPTTKIGITQPELDRIAKAKAAGQCVGAMKAYYAVKTYNVRLKDGSTILVEALDKESAERKAEDAGHQVAWVTRKFGVEEEKVIPKDEGEEKDWVKDYLTKKDGWNEDYLVEGGYDLVRMLDDCYPAHDSKFSPYDLRDLFGDKAVNEAGAMLDTYRATNDLKPYLRQDEVHLSALIADKGLKGAIDLMDRAGVENAAEFVQAYKDMPEHWQAYADENGFGGLQFKVDGCGDILKEYKQPDGSYDIYQALLDPDDWREAQQHQDAISFLFGSEVTDQALSGLHTMRQEVTAPYPVPGDKIKGKDVSSFWEKAREVQHTVGVYVGGANPLPLWVQDNIYAPEAQAYMKAYGEALSELPWYKALFTGTSVTHHSAEQLAKLPAKEKQKLKDAGVDISKGLWAPVISGYPPMIIPVGTGIGAVAAGVGQKLVKIPKWYWTAPSNVIMKVAAKIPGLMTLPIIRGIPQLAATAVRMVTVGVPAYYTAAYIAEKVKASDIQRQWNIFNNLPDSKKDEWAAKCGYKKWEGLDEGQQAAVLARFAVPTSYTSTEWTEALGGYTQKLIEIGNKGAGWILGQEPVVPDVKQASIAGAPVQYLGAFGLGVGTGLAESLMYMAAIPLVLTNIFIRIPTGEAWAYSTWVASGMLEFFREVPGTFVSGPFGAGRMVGLFVLSPESAYKLSKGVLAALSPRYVPERAMGIRLNTLRVIFTSKQLDLLSEMSAAELKLLGTRIGATLMEGKNYIKGFGRIKLEVKTVPYQKVVGNALWHFTPDITPFLKGKSVPIVGKLYTSPHAAISAGVQSLVMGIRGTKPGLVEVRVPSGYTIKGASIEKLLASGRAVEIEAPLRGALDPIPGFTGKGVSSNMYFGTYPIRRFTLKGVDTPIAKLTPKELLKVRALAMQEAVADVFLGWSGRLEAIKRDLAGSKQLRQTLKNIDDSVSSVKASLDSKVGKNGQIVSQIEFKHPSGGLVGEKVRGLIIDKDGRVLFARDKADPVGVYDAIGGSCNVKEVLIPSKGKWNYELPLRERPVITWELAFKSQAYGELNIKIRNVKYMGMYRGKVGEHSVYGTRIYESRVDSGYIDRVTAWRKFQEKTFKYAEPEIAEAFWWDGKSVLKGTVQPWFYDMLAAVSSKYGWDMSKVKVSTISGKFVRDLAFPDRVRSGLNPDLKTGQRKSAEIGWLKDTYSQLMMPSVRDYVLKGGSDIALMTELLRGRQQAVKWTSTKPADLGKAGGYLVTTLNSLRDRIKAMSNEVFGREYGELGISKQALLNKLDNLRLTELLGKYKQLKTKSTANNLQAEIDRITKVQMDLFNRWMMESNVRTYLDSGIISGRYTAYLDKMARAVAAGVDAEDAPLLEGLPEYEYAALPSAEYVTKYAVPAGERDAFTYTTDYSMPTYAELNRYPAYAKQAQYQKVAQYYEPSRTVATSYKVPEYKREEYKPQLPYPPYPPYPPVPPRPPVPPVPPVPRQKVVLVDKGGKKYYKLPRGSIAWKQGLFWKYIPPPWRQEKPITIKHPPLGARFIGSRTPKETIQMIGKAKAKVPKSASIDLGVVDIFIENYGKEISFRGKGLETVVGHSLGSTTKGMSIPGTAPMKVTQNNVKSKRRRNSNKRKELVRSASAG